MNESVRREANEMTRLYSTELPKSLDGSISGVYLVGSYALNDLQVGSDVDFITVISRPVSETERTEIDALHQLIQSRYPARDFEGLYVTTDDLQHHPRDAASVLRYGDKKKLESGKVGPIEWEMLRRHGVAVFGPSREALRVFDCEAEMPLYSLENLTSYWKPWVARAAELASMATESQTAWSLEWMILGIPRLHAAIATGEILSKSAAAAYSLQVFDRRYHPAIEASLQFRQRRDDHSLTALIKLRESGLAFARVVIDDAERMNGRDETSRG